MLITTTSVGISTIELHYNTTIPNKVLENHLHLYLDVHATSCNFYRCIGCPAKDTCIVNGSDFHDVILKYFPTVTADYPELFI